MRNEPAGTITISGQTSQSLKLSPGFGAADGFCAEAGAVATAMRMPMRIVPKRMLASNKLSVILRSSARSAERLEGWKQTRCVWPSFETAVLRTASSG
jgi:hypothetical protein